MTKKSFIYLSLFLLAAVFIFGACAQTISAADFAPPLPDSLSPQPDTADASMQEKVNAVLARIDKSAGDLGAASAIFSNNRYSDLTTPLRMYGYLTARFQDVNVRGQGAVNHSSMEEFISMWFNGVVDRVQYKLMFNIERPNDDGRVAPSFFSTGRVFIDEFSLMAGLDDLVVKTGMLWQSTNIVAKQLTSRPMLFEKDIYQGEFEDTKSKYDMAFLKGQVSRDARWSKIPVYGAEVQWKLLGRSVNVFAGKLNKFYDDFTPYNRYALDGILNLGTLFDNFFFIDKFDLTTEVFNSSNDYGEIIGLFPKQAKTVDTLKENNTVYFVESNLKLFDFVKLNASYSTSFYDNKYFSDQTGNYFDGTVKMDPFSGLGFRMPITVGAFMIDADYTSLESNITETKKRGESDWEILLADAVKKKPPYYTNVEDTTLPSNNSEGIYANTQFRLPFVLLAVNYGYKTQIQATGNTIVAAHFLNGQNSNGAMWWHSFNSSYGYPFGTEYFNGFANYNATYESTINAFSTPGSPMYKYRALMTFGWRDNQELLTLAQGRPYSKNVSDTLKETSNFSGDLRFDLSGMLGMERSLYLQVYSELVNITEDGTYFPGIDTSGPLFWESISDVVLSYNFIQQANIIFEYGREFWRSDWTKGYTVDYDYTTYGAGFEWNIVKDFNFFLRAKYFTFVDRSVPNKNDKETTEGYTYTKDHPVAGLNNFNGVFIYTEIKNFF